MALSMETSTCSSALSLSGNMPLSRSEYLEKSEIFSGSSAIPPLRSVVVFREPHIARSESDSSDASTIQESASAFADRMKRLWAKIRSMTADGFDKSAIDPAKRNAALQFKESLQAIDDAHGPHRFCFDIQIPRVAIRPEDFSSLDDALDDAMTSSLVVEGGEEDKGLRDDFVKISLDIRRDSDDAEVTYIILEELELELNQVAAGIH
ncbi:hypothetical protein TWF281_001412 [Arthrobotrys megalospora]